MINWTKRISGVSAIAMLTCSAAMAVELNVSVTSGGSDTITVMPCGATVLYEVGGILSDDANLGLAGFVCDLVFSGEAQMPIDISAVGKGDVAAYGDRTVLIAPVAVPGFASRHTHSTIKASPRADGDVPTNPPHPACNTRCRSPRGF